MSVLFESWHGLEDCDVKVWDEDGRVGEAFEGGERRITTADVPEEEGVQTVPSNGAIDLSEDAIGLTVKKATSNAVLYGIFNDRIDDLSTGRGGELGDGIIIFIWEEQFQSIPMIRCQVVSSKKIFGGSFVGS